MLVVTSASERHNGVGTTAAMCLKTFCAGRRFSGASPGGRISKICCYNDVCCSGPKHSECLCLVAVIGP